MNYSKIKIEALVSAEKSKVWDCYTEPKHITHWNFASPDWHCPKASNDLKVGGKYSARMEAKDGSFGFEFVAIYDEVDASNKIVYTMEDGRKVTTTFEAASNQTKVTTVFDAEKENPEEMQREGWQSILNNFKAYVERI